MNSYVVAGTKPWNRTVFNNVISKFPGTWRYIYPCFDQSHPIIFDMDPKPKYIFYLHWSNKIPDEIINNFECVCFHMTNVPFGRGGSPLQNLISRGIMETKLTALKMVEQFDAGPVYLQETLSLHGTAEEIYERSSLLAAKMIEQIIQSDIEPKEQEGPVTIFKRRKPAQSEIEVDNLDAVYDHIRMLDAEGYPKAFINYNGLKLEFSRACKYHGKIKCDVTITEGEKDGN